MKDILLDSIDVRILNALQDNASASNQDLAAQVHVSPATCLRRVRRLKDAGLIDRQIALLSPDRLAQTMGHGLSALIEVTLDRQDADALDAFEAHACADEEVQQCWRVSPGPDFILVVRVADMPAYQALAQRLFNAHRNVRNVRAFFAVRQAKFHPKIAIPSVKS